MNTSNFDEAAANLAAALKASAKAANSAKLSISEFADSYSSKDEVSLTMIQGVPEYIWKLMHPQGLDGKFVMKGTGVFLYGHTKSAFAKNDAGSDVSIPLEPGDKLYQTKTGSKVVVHGDNTAQVFSTKSGSLGTKINAPADGSSWESQKMFEGAKLLDSSHAIEIKSDNVDDATAQVKATLKKHSIGTYDVAKTDATPDKPATPSPAVHDATKDTPTPNPEKPLAQWEKELLGSYHNQQEKAAQSDKVGQAVNDAIPAWEKELEKLNNELNPPKAPDHSKSEGLTLKDGGFIPFDVPSYVAVSPEDSVFAKHGKFGDTNISYAVEHKDGSSSFYSTPTTQPIHHSDPNALTFIKIDTSWNQIKFPAIEKKPFSFDAKNKDVWAVPDSPNFIVHNPEIDDWTEVNSQGQTVSGVGPSKKSKVLKDKLSYKKVQDAYPASGSFGASIPKAINADGKDVYADSSWPGDWATVDSQGTVLSWGYSAPDAGSNSGGWQSHDETSGSFANEIIAQENGWKKVSSGISSAKPENSVVEVPASDVPSVSSLPDSSSFPKPAANSQAVKSNVDASVTSTKAGPPYGPNVWVTPDWIDPSSGKPYLMSAQGEATAYSVFAGDTPPAQVTNSKGVTSFGLDSSGLLFTAVNKKSAKAWIVSMNDLGDSNPTENSPNLPSGVSKTLAAEDAVSSPLTSADFPTPPNSLSDSSVPTNSPEIPSSLNLTGKDVWSSADGHLLTYDPTNKKWTYLTKDQSPAWQSISDKSIYNASDTTPEIVSNIISDGSGWDKIQKSGPSSNDTAAPTNTEIVPGVNTTGLFVYQSPGKKFVYTYNPENNAWNRYYDDKSLGKFTLISDGPIDSTLKATILDSWTPLTSPVGAPPTVNNPNYSDAVNAVINNSKFSSMNVYNVDGVPVVHNFITGTLSQVNADSSTTEATLSQWKAIMSTPDLASGSKLPSIILDSNNRVFFDSGTFYVEQPNGSVSKVWPSASGFKVSGLSVNSIPQASTEIFPSVLPNGDVINDTPLSDKVLEQYSGKDIYVKSLTSPSLLPHLIVDESTDSYDSVFTDPLTGDILSGLTKTGNSLSSLKSVPGLMSAFQKKHDAVIPEPVTTPDAPSVDTPTPDAPSVDAGVAVKFTKNYVGASKDIHWQVLGVLNSDGKPYSVVSHNGTYEVYSDSSEQTLLGSFKKSKDAKQWLVDNAGKSPDTAPESPVDAAPEVVPTPEAPKSKPMVLDPSTDFFEFNDGKSASDVVSFVKITPFFGTEKLYGLDAEGNVVGTTNHNPNLTTLDSLLAYTSKKTEFSTGDDLTVLSSPEPDNGKYASYWPDETLDTQAISNPNLADGSSLSDVAYWTSISPANGVEVSVGVDASGKIIATDTGKAWMGESVEKFFNVSKTSNFPFSWVSAEHATTPDPTPELVNFDPAIPYWGATLNMDKGSWEDYFDTNEKIALPPTTKYLVRFPGYSALHGVDSNGFIVGTIGNSPINFVGDSVASHDSENHKIKFLGEVPSNMLADPTPVVSDFTPPVANVPNIKNLEKEVGNNVSVEPLSPNDEEPTLSNPTPGDPKAHLAVPVVGIKGAAGSYLTAKLKDKDGKPYFITANGKPNNWEVYDSENFAKLSLDDVTQVWTGDATPLGKFKQLKDAKAWLAGPQEQTGTTSSPLSVESKNGLIKIEYAGGNIYVPSSNVVLISQDKSTVHVMQSSDSSYYLTGTDPEPQANYSYSASQLIKNQGFKALGGDTPDTSKAIKKGLETPSMSTSPAFYEGVDSLYALRQAALNLNNPYVGYSFNSSVIDKYDSAQELYQQQLVPLHQSLLENNLSLLHQKALEVYSNQKGGDKTKARKALNKIERQIVVTGLLQKMKDGEDFTSEDYAVISDYASNSLTGVYYSGALESLAQGLLLVAKKQQISKNLKEAGVDSNYSDIKVSNNTVSITNEQLDSVKKLAGELGFEYAGHLGTDTAGSYLFATYTGNLSSIYNLKKPIQQAVVFASVQSDFEVWQAEHNGSKINPEPGEVTGDISKISNPSINFSLTDHYLDTSNNTLYTAHGDGYQSTEGKYISVSSARFLEAIGQFKPAHDDKTLVESPDIYTRNSASFDGETALWNISDAQVSEMSLSDSLVYTKANNPLTLSLIDVTGNPYADLKDSADSAWVAFAKHVVDTAPEFWNSDGQSGDNFETLKSAFFLKTTPFMGYEQKQKLTDWLADVVLPHLKSKAPNLSPETSSGFAGINDSKTTLPVPQKPVDFNPQVWALIQGAVNGFSSENLTSLPVPDSGANAFQKSLKDFAPFLDYSKVPSALVSLAYLYRTKNGIYGSGDAPGFNAVVNAIGKYAEAGYWSIQTNPTDIPVPAEYTSDIGLLSTNGVMKNIKIPAGGTVSMTAAYNYMSLSDSNSSYGVKVLVASADKKTGYFLSKNYSGEVNYSPITESQLEAYLNNPESFKTIYWSHIDLDKKFFSADTPSVTQPEIDTLVGSKNATYSDVSIPGFGDTNYGDTLVALKTAIKQNPDKYELLNDHFSELSPGMLKVMHYGVKTGNDNFLSMLSTMYSYGQIQPKESATDKNLPTVDVSPYALYYDKVVSGQISFSAINNDWSMEESQAAAKDLLGIDAGTYDTKYSFYDQQMADILNNKLPQPSSKQTNAQPSVMTLHKIKGTDLGGMHTKQQWADDNGEVWMSKAFASDPNSKARIDAEHYSMRIADLYNWNPPATFAMQTPDGSYAYVQHLAPASGSLQHKGWKDIPTSVLHEAMSHHVLDWIISNHDSHSENIMITEDGKSAFPIDRGQAFKHFPKDKLAVNYLPSGNFAPVWYDSVYHSIQNHEMSKEQLDNLRDYVLRKAAIVTSRDDETYKKYVSAALASRKNFPSELPTANAMVNALMERKAKTFDDFQKLWKGLYKSAGVDFEGDKSIDDYLPKKIGKAYSAVTPDFATDVSKSNSVGVPLFFGGEEFDNGHMQVYTSVASTGTTTLKMFGKLRANAEKVLTDWLNKQSIDKVSHSSSYSDPNPWSPPPPSHTLLPGIDSAFSTLVSYGTTVGSHNKKGDYEYNTSTLATAKDTVEKLQTEVQNIETWNANNGSLYTSDVFGYKFVTGEQQQAWLTAAKEMLENYKLIDNAKDQKLSPSVMYPGKVPFKTPPVYTPSANIDTSGKPKIVEAYTVDNGGVEKFSDGSFVFTSSDGVTSTIDKEQYSAYKDSGTPANFENPTDAVAPVDDNGMTDGESVTASAGTQIVKVTHRGAKFLSGTMDYNTGVVTDTANGATKGAQGSEYLIEFDDVKIQFQHSNDVSVNGQKSLMRITISDWEKGGTQQIENALATLRSMGLSLAPADEQALEMLYWRQIYGTLQNRKLNSQFTAVKKELDSANLSALSAGEEINRYREAFGKVYGPSTLTEFIEKGGHLPQMSKHVTSGGADGVYGGRPYWLHPDVMDMEKVRQASGGKVLVHDISYGASGKEQTYAKNIAKVGFHSTEERIRVLGEFVNGMSSLADQGHNSSQYMFTRAGNSPTSWNIALDPLVFMRISNYILDNDHFGEASMKGQSPFSTTEFAAVGGFNEAMIKDGVSLMSDFSSIVVPNEAIRSELIKFYNDMGITEIRGLPVGDRIVANGSAASTSVKKSWDRIIENQKKGIMPWLSE